MGITSWGAGNVAIRTGLNGVRVTDAPAAGEVLTATSSTTADWEAGGGGGGGAVDSVDGQIGAVDLSGTYAPIAAASPIQLRAFEIGWDTPNIGTTGAVLFVPAVGDRLLGAWVETTEAFDVSTQVQVGPVAAITANQAISAYLAAEAADGSADSATSFTGGFISTGTVRLITTSPIVAKLGGSDTTGQCLLFILVCPASAIAAAGG